MIDIHYIAVILLLSIGFYGILFKRNLIKTIIGLSIIEYAVNLFLITLAYVDGGVAAIYTLAPHENMVFPVPHALVLTSIVIGLATTALMLGLAVNIYQKYDTLDTQFVRRLKE
ncbi:cation:proton antiporter [archaeon SCG-AAA382B04]|nr:cation:proton antiporter [archaeon SCG-AAA382B04]